MRKLSQKIQLIVFALSAVILVLPPTAFAQFHMSTQEHKKLDRDCRNGDGAKCERLAKRYDSIGKAGGGAGWSESSAFRKKIEYAKLGCALKQKYSCDAVGRAYEHGAESLPQDDDHAVVYYVNGCENGSGLSCNNLSLLARAGRGMKQSEENYVLLQKRACSLGYSNACNDPASIAAREKQAAEDAVRNQYATMEFAALQDACTAQGDERACIEVYDRVRSEEPDAYVVAEHICNNWNRARYCYEAGMDLYAGNGKMAQDHERAFNNLYKGCYIRGDGQAEACYFGASMRMSSGGRQGFYDAMLMLESPCLQNYRDSCALKRKAQNAGDAEVSAMNRRARGDDPDEILCRPDRFVGHGGRSYTRYDCKKRFQWERGL